MMKALYYIGLFLFYWNIQNNKNINIFIVLYINICYNTNMIADVYIRQI